MIYYYYNSDFPRYMQLNRTDKMQNHPYEKRFRFDGKNKS